MKDRLKELQELRGAKVKALDELRTKVAAEKRSYSPDEGKQVDSLLTEIDNIGADQERELRSVAALTARATPLSGSEEKDLSKFSLLKLVKGLQRAQEGKGSLDGIEKEMADEGEAEARDAGVPIKGVQLPRMLVRRADRTRARFSRDAVLSATGSASVTGDLGGITVATTPVGLLDDFYNALVLEPAGAMIVEGLRGNLILPRLIADTDSAAKTENANADQLTPTTLGLSLSPKRYPAYIDLSEQLLMQSEVAFEKIVRANSTRQLSAKVQKDVFNGAGSSGAIAGILNASTYTLATVYAGGATSNSTNADGSAQVYRDWTRLRTKVASQDAPLDRFGFITNSRVVGQAFETKRGLATPSDTVATDSRMIIDDPAVMRVAGFPVFETNGVPATLSKGASSGILSAILAGAWSDLYMGFWSGINVELVRDATLAIAGEYRLVLSVYTDAGIVRTKSFAKCIDVNAP